ncbi:hypothetical protein BDN70DRAFT_805008 [Pholiota conissans]|uniref:PH domain-containing protein n=1 Tax=Pholiota conissans TaxID=109636 RepID=A0A9P6D2E8_9AGAR|nr:hypothetical protein BDN70DRAFT_805008 [Pholiota conissans]
MPDFSSSHHSFSNAGDVKLHIQNIFQNKAEQLLHTGNLGQRILTQQAELEARLKEIEVLEADKGEEETRERYHELVDTILEWEEENAQLLSCFSSNAKVSGDVHSPAMPYTDLGREEPERIKSSAGTSVAQSRRAKNAAHRADDVEFAFEIGSGLLTEVRRLQSLLGERDKAIQDMKEEKDDLEKSVEGLRAALKQQEQNSDKFKEENWNLEVRFQELHAKNEDTVATLQRLESDHKRLTKALAQSRDAADQHKNEGERLANVIEEMKAKHDTDIAQARRNAAGLMRDKSDLQQAMDTLKAEVARAGRRLPKYGSPLTPGGPETMDFLTPAGHNDPDDVFGTTGRGSTNRRNLDVSSLFPPEDLGDFADSPDPSPLRKPFLAANHPTNEIEALQQRLAHAQRQINTLKGSLNREKQLRIRLENGADIPDADEDQQEEYVDENTAVVENKRPAKRSTTPFKVGGGRGGARGRGRGRGRGGITLIQRLGMAAGSPSSDYNDDDQPENLSDEAAPPVPPIPIRFNQGDDEDEVSQFFGSSHDHQQEVEEEEEVQRSRSPSPTPMEPHSNRTSVDGMDPAFANVLRRTPSNGSYTGSPLRQAVLGRSARGRAPGRRPRGGVPFKEARPPSIVDAPEVLATELGGFESSPLKGANTSLLNDAEIIEEDVDDAEYIRVKKVEKVEFGCQTEVIEEEKTIILVEPPVVVPAVPEALPEPEPAQEPETVHVEMGVQSDPEPEPVLPEPVVRMEMGIQSEPEPEPVLPPKPVTVDTSLQTEPEPVVVVEKSDMGIQHHTPEPVLPPSPVLVESGVGTDPLPEPVVAQSGLGRGLPPLVIGDTARRSTITQADVSRTNSSVGDTTITRTFLSHQAVGDEDEIDEGEETETGAETEDDYHDARQSIMMTTPSEDYHSVRTMTDNDYSDSEDDAESIKASNFSARHHRSTSSLNRPPTSASSYFAPVPTRTVSYETVGVSADLYEPPEPVIVEVEVPVEAPKPEVKEMSIQTDEWKPPAPIVPVTIPSPSPKPALYRVGSTTNHQFQFIPPPTAPPPANGTNGLSSSTQGPVFTAPSPVHTPLSSIFRESSGTTGRRTATSDRRQSIESHTSSGTAAEEPSNRSRVPSASGPILTSTDKTRPPVMSLPPPPKLPPPPNSMPPPNFIPERRLTSSGIRDVPPPRPSSPPPAELIQRATTPLGSILSVPGTHSIRSHAASMPPSQANLRQPPSTSSFRSAANATSHAYVPSTVLSSHSVRERDRQARSTTSLTSDHSVASPRSSMSSDRHLYDPSASVGEAPSTPNKSADITPRANNNAMSTDPAIIHAITQTMIGEFLYKYTRKAIGKGVGERRHKRFFWVHPYTKTLYWSSADPGSSNVSEQSAKSAYIEGVRSVLDPNPMPPGLYQYSVVVSTPQREMKITALTKERHDIWLNALKYLLSRPNNPNVTSPGNNTILPETPDNTDHGRRPPQTTSPQSQRSARSPNAGEPWNTTPRGQRSRSQLSVRGSAGKRSGTPALEYLRWNAPESPYSPDRSFVDVPAQDPDDLDFELHDDTMSDEGYEGLENVRACCDGRHTVGHHHHHQHNHNNQVNQGTLSSRRSMDTQHLEPNAPEHVRPSSPAWSFRSRTGSSAQSNEGGGLFSWGRGDDGKLRFGSRRSTKTSVPAHD